MCKAAQERTFLFSSFFRKVWETPRRRCSRGASSAIRGQASQTGQCLWKESPYTDAGFSYTPPTYRRPLSRVPGHRRRRPAARRGGRHVSLFPLSGVVERLSSAVCGLLSPHQTALNQRDELSLGVRIPL